MTLKLFHWRDITIWRDGDRVVRGGEKSNPQRFPEPFFEISNT
jgi:hypothetical protein